MEIRLLMLFFILQAWRQNRSFYKTQVINTLYVLKFQNGYIPI